MTLNWHPQDPQTEQRSVSVSLYIKLRQTLTTNTVTFSISSSLYCPPQTLTTNTVTFSISSSLYCPPQTLTTNTVTFSVSSYLYCPPQTLSTNTVTFSINSYIQAVPGGKDLTSGECSLGQTIPI